MTLQPVSSPLHQEVSMSVGTAARLTRAKGIDLLLQAVARLPSVSVVIAGDGPDKGEFEALARQLSLGDRCRFLGWIDAPSTLLGQIDVFVLPSLKEGLPITILEAMSAGLPVVATEVGSVCEAVADGETGILVPPGDVDSLVQALDRLLKNPGERTSFGAAGRRRAEHLFDIEISAARYAEVYRSAVR